jgi:hypothetical protein
MKKESILRYVGNFLLLLGYFFMVWVDLKTGITIKFLAGFLTLPFSIKLKLWDVLVLTGFFTIIDATKLIDLYF